MPYSDRTLCIVLSHLENSHKDKLFSNIYFNCDDIIYKPYEYLPREDKNFLFFILLLL